MACVVGQSVTTSLTDFSLPKPSFWKFIWIFNGRNHLKMMRKHMFSTKMYTFMRNLTFFWAERLSSHNKHPPPWSIRFSTTYSPSKKKLPYQLYEPHEKGEPNIINCAMNIFNTWARAKHQNIDIQLCLRTKQNTHEQNHGR